MQRLSDAVWLKYINRMAQNWPYRRTGPLLGISAQVTKQGADVHYKADVHAVRPR